MAKAEETSGNQAHAGSIEELFAAHESGLLAYARRLLRDNEAAQDIVQDAFMKLYQNFNQVRQPRVWLYRTVHNRAMNHHRALRKLLSVDPTESALNSEPQESEPIPDDHAQRLEAIGQTRLCLEALQERERELLRLKFEEGLSYKAISERTGLTVGHVGYLLHHALKSLAGELAKLGIIQ